MRRGRMACKTGARLPLHRKKAALPRAAAEEGGFVWLLLRKAVLELTYFSSQMGSFSIQRPYSSL